MNTNYEKVKSYLLELGFDISREDEEDNVLVIEDESSGVNQMVIGIADTLVIFEQYIFTVPKDSTDLFKALLIKNRDIIHGAFVLSEDGKKVLFRDTLQVENLDLNEIEATISSLGLLLSEYSDQLIKFSHSK